MNSIENEENSQIVNAVLFIDALKSSGYKSTYNAIAEIVDNSIDASAKDIIVIGEQNCTANKEKSIVSFAFLDNGKGMDYETLKKCLTIGYTTNNERKGMGRFGVGLPQASLFVCDRVEVYSWQGGIDNTFMVYLDVDEIHAENQNEIKKPEKCTIPSEYKKYLSYNTGNSDNNKILDFNKNGTLVVWKRCSTVDHKRWKTCEQHMKMDLGRKYRYFLEKGDCNIYFAELINQSFSKLLPNDPLYLMVPSQECVPNNIQDFINNDYKLEPYNEKNDYVMPLFEVFKGDVNAPDYVEKKIVFEDHGERKTGTVKIKYSIIKREFYSKETLCTTKKPGSLSFGKSPLLNDNLGISIVRNNREIDFGSFGFFDIYNAPENRWWGIEISFSSDLDVAFGISNNKQSVSLKRMSEEEMREALNDEIQSVWLQLNEEISKTIEAMKKRNTSIRNEKSEAETDKPDETSSIVSAINDNESDDENEEEASETTKMDVALKQLKKEGIENPTDIQIKNFIDSNVRVSVVSNKSKMDSFIDYSYAAGILSIILNRNHMFYEKFASFIMDEDEDLKVPFELFLVAVIKSIKKLSFSYNDAMDQLLHQINIKIFEYMEEYNRRNG